MAEELKTGKRPPPPPREVSLEPGQFLFRQGEHPKDIFVIKEGTLAVLNVSGESEIELARLGVGAVIGEMALLDDAPRSASVRALTHSRALVIGFQTIAALLRQIPPWLSTVIKVIIRRLRQSNQRLNQPLVERILPCVASFIDLQIACSPVGGALRWEFFSLADEFTLLTKLNRNQFDKGLHGLSELGLLQVSRDSKGNQFISVAERRLVQTFAAYQQSILADRPYAPFELGITAQEVLAALVEGTGWRMGAFNSNPSYPPLAQLLGLITESIPLASPETLLSLIDARLLCRIPEQDALYLDRDRGLDFLVALRHREAFCSPEAAQ